MPELRQFFNFGLWLGAAGLLGLTFSEFMEFAADRVIDGQQSVINEWESGDQRARTDYSEGSIKHFKEGILLARASKQTFEALGTASAYIAGAGVVIISARFFEALSNVRRENKS